MLDALRRFVRQLWQKRPSRARGVSAFGIPILEPVEMSFGEERAVEAPVAEAPSQPDAELALDLEALLLAHDPAEARTTAVAADDLSMLSFQRRRSG